MYTRRIWIGYYLFVIVIVALAEAVDMLVALTCTVLGDSTLPVNV